MNVETIHYGIDLEFFAYSDKEPEEPMIGYVGRVVPWKGLKQVAEIAEELGYKLQMMGKPDKMDYWNEVPKDSLRFDYMDCEDSERANAYHSMTIYVGNSQDDYEEGTLPYLEAMACGVPIVTTPSGMAKDLVQDEINALVVPFQDKEALKMQIQRAMEDADLRKKLRKNGWNTVKNLPEEKMSWEYSKLFWKVAFPEKELVSVIIPTTFDRSEQVNKILQSLINQTYQPVEAIIVWDEVWASNIKLGIPAMSSVDDLALENNFTVKHIVTDKAGYNLAMARNLGAIEAQGKYLMFCDSRLEPQEESVFMFMTAMEAINGGKYWMFGDKGSQKKSFVENFSFIKRDEFMKFGMMNERIDSYGGMSQEIRTRWVKQGGQLEYIETAKAKELMCGIMLGLSIGTQKLLIGERVINTIWVDYPCAILMEIQLWKHIRDMMICSYGIG